MPTLLELQRAVYRSLVQRDDDPASTHVLADGFAPEARLNVYRNTFAGGLTTALRLSFPAVHRLVGAAFFESAARIFLERHPPRSAYLDEYGSEFPSFLSQFEPASSLPYLPGVARLEWAVSQALHAPDTEPLDVLELAAVDPAHQPTMRFVPHPALSLVRAGYPVDEIWRAVLEQDDAVLTTIDLDEGTVRLIVERSEHELRVRRIDEPAWCFLTTLCAARPLQAAIDTVPELDAGTALADHLASGRFVGFELGH